jgi:hypothetical protein
MYDLAEKNQAGGADSMQSYTLPSQVCSFDESFELKMTTVH